ncbi:sulfatase-like hydrolase/transferase [Lentisphaera profundi]|uniref:Sulfatase-like hydrolase/transferase n=1 Tax=Lentisphaera profundi TaxID=1658616 RepID=A0ABY7VQP7_9BACT|nr:sulfatase-like hydrolase/transferase [Lentisphaera profundi]WDE96516.1 sulfatase-like hydrolase/transferase [Lentisphaera profundi]
MRFLSLLLLFSLCTTASDKPNIIVILSDDVGFEEFGVYGVRKEASKTPNIDRLAERGVAFQTCWGQAICGPSRAVFFSGNYALHTGRYDNKLNFIPNGDVRKNKLPQFTKILHDGGYRVGFAGKWHNDLGGKLGLENDKLGIDEYVYYASANTLEKITGETLVPDENWEVGALSKEVITSRYWKPHLAKNGKLMKTTMNDYGPDIYTDFICDFIKRNAQAKQPFLAVYPMALAHTAHTVTPIEVAAGAKPSNKHYRKGSPEGRKCFENQIRYMDKLVGKIVEQVEKSGVAENTIIIYSSDNGTTSSSKGRGVEYGIHVPMIVAGAGIKQRGMVSQLTDFTDVLPTLVDFAGLSLPKDKNVDGNSLKLFLTGNSEKTKPVIYAFPGISRLVRTEDFMLEAVAPLYDKPRGRFYKTHGSFDGRGYENVTHNAEYAIKRKEFDQLMNDYPSTLPTDFKDPLWKSYKGMDKGLKHFQSKGQIKNHLSHPEEYKFYDSSF